MSRLRVYFQQEPCGVLEEQAGGALSFRYLDPWIEAGRHPVSLRFPVEEREFAHERVAPFVASFLPEGESLRRRLERLIHVDANHDFGLLTALGRESAGALSFWPEDESPFLEAPAYDALSPEEFEAWREYAHQTPLHFPGRSVRLSLAGAQTKTALYFDEEDRPFIPENGAPTTHILKPRISGCRPSSVHVEWLTMRLARAIVGEDRVPQADLWGNCYRVRRFDRPRHEGTVRRLHQEDFCLALGRMPSGKYESGSPRERLLAPCFFLLDELGEQGRIQSPAIERQRLLDQVIINVLLHNPDAHLKNHALLYREDGYLEIAPLYDCLCTEGMAFQASDATGWERTSGPAMHTRELSLQIGNARQIDEVRLEDWELFAEECGFTRALIRRRLKAMTEQIADELDDVLETLLAEVPNAGGAANTVRRAVSAQLRQASARAGR